MARSLTNCINCGRQIPADSIVCPYCGVSQVVTQMSAEDKKRLDKMADAELLEQKGKALQEVGCGLTQLGCLIPIVLILLFIIWVSFT